MASGVSGTIFELGSSRTSPETNSRAYFELFRDSFGPMVAIRAGLRDHAARIAELDAAFMKFITRWNRGASEGQVRIPYEYLLVLAYKLCA